MSRNIAVNDKTIERAPQAGKPIMKKAAGSKAPLKSIEKREQMKVLSLFGSIEYDEGYDYKKQRSIS